MKLTWLKKTWTTYLMLVFTCCLGFPFAWLSVFRLWVDNHFLHIGMAQMNFAWAMLGLFVGFWLGVTGQFFDFDREMRHARRFLPPPRLIRLSERGARAGSAGARRLYRRTPGHNHRGRQG